MFDDEKHLLGKYLHRSPISHSGQENKVDLKTCYMYDITLPSSILNSLKTNMNMYTFKYTL